MTAMTDKNSGGTTLVSYGYTYNSGGMVSQEVRHWASGASTDTLNYTYTNNDQLTQVTHTNGSFSTESFTYDANGNETGTGYTTSTGNEQTASPGYTYTYDADGNMITSTQTSTGDVRTYSYDFRNRLVGAVEKTSGGTTLEQVTYTYDALDNRIGMDENSTQTWTLYDGSKPIIDFNGSGTLEMRYLNGPAGDLVDTVLSRQSSGGTIAWYLPDRVGTVRDLINNSGGIIDHVDYSAFGTVLDESTPANGDRFTGFAGMERDTGTGLNLAVMRQENPGTGRWDSPDALGFGAGDANLDRYVGNAPTSADDPSGLYKVNRGSFLGGNWTATQMQDVTNMLNAIRNRIGALFGEINAAFNGLTPCEQRFMRNDINTLRSMLQQMLAGLNSNNPIYFRHGNLTGSQSGDSANTDQSAGPWPIITFNDNFPWTGATWVLAHELSHLAGTYDSQLFGYDPLYDPIEYQGLFQLPFIQTNLFATLLANARRRAASSSCRGGRLPTDPVTMPAHNR